MSTLTIPVTGIIGKMRDSGVPIRLAVKFHTLMRKQPDSKKARKAVRVVLLNIRNNFNATH